jgi:hypothetical protein
LTSIGFSGYYKLFGPDGECTISVCDSGVLRLDGIIVTHVKGVSGGEVSVSSPNDYLSSSVVLSGLFMYSGEISGNAADISF